MTCALLSWEEEHLSTDRKAIPPGSQSRSLQSANKRAVTVLTGQRRSVPGSVTALDRWASGRWDRREGFVDEKRLS